MGVKNKQKKNAKEKEQIIAKETKSVDVPNTVTPEDSGTADVFMGEQSNNNEEQKAAYRKRKKHYYNAIRAQMEFYFGDANLSKDRFLKQLIDKDPYVPLEVFMTFNKIKALTSKVDDIAKSLTNSELLELDVSQRKVKRKIPLNHDRNVDEKTLYVEALPSTADHEWVRQIFERFGKVAYISLPKYAKSRKIKEFGFVEFERKESVNKAIAAFKEFNGVLNMQEKNPSELISVKSYIKEQSCESEEKNNSAIPVTPKKRSNSQSLGDETEPKAKKSKIEPHGESETPNTESSATASENDTKDNIENATKKKRRKRKRKSNTTEKLKQKAELTTDVAYYELKILPKKDWKRLRNKYLNLQREKVAEMKRKAWREQQEIRQRDLATFEENSSLPTGQEQKQALKSATKHKFQKINMNFYGAADEDIPLKGSITEKNSHQDLALERAPLFTFQPGLIVEVSFLEPCTNVKEFKADMRQYSSVKYIDIKEGSMQGYLRLETCQKAENFIQQINCAEYQCKILSGDAETGYWKKIEKDREQKLSKQIKLPQKRGREKVKKLLSKHIRFGDDDE